MKEDELVMVELEGDTLSLAELSGQDLTNVAEQRFSTLPAGLYVFDVATGEDAPKLGQIESTNKKTKETRNKAAAIFIMTVADVVSLKHQEEAPEGNPLNLIGKKHRETFFISDLASFGYPKAFVKDIGGDNTGPCGGVSGAPEGWLDKAAGLRFQAFITVRKDKEDEDRTYTNIRRDKIIPMEAPAQSEVAGALAG